MTTAAMLAELHTCRARAATLVVRHVGALVSTQRTITPDRLAKIAPIGETHDRTIIGAAFDAIAAAHPEPTMELAEQRWHLTFADAEGAHLATVMSASFAPFYGTIDGSDVVFAHDALVRWLADHFAPNEAALYK